MCDSVVNFAILVALIGLLGFGTYSLWDSKQVFAVADAKQYSEFKPAADEEASLSFEELRKMNPEVFGWITVYDTHIDYPIMQGEDNMKYVSTDAMGKYCMTGGIFLDYRNQQDFSDLNSIFYGHHMAESAMFGDIGLFVDETYFNQRPYGNLYFEDKNHGIEFFAFLEIDAYDTSVFGTPVTGDKEKQAYLDNLFDIALHSREIDVTIEDHLILLSTCTSTSTNGRHLLVGRVVDQVFSESENFVLENNK